MRSWDVIIVGAGIIGLSLATALRKKGIRVLLVERGEPGREASYAAAGMLAALGDEIPVTLKPFAEESARLYPEFVHELEDESGITVDLREQGTIAIACAGHIPAASEPLSPQRLRSLEPELAFPCDSNDANEVVAGYIGERSLDPRALIAAATKAVHHRQVDISSGSEVTSLLVANGRAAGVQTAKTTYAAPIVVNCAGAWAGQIAPVALPLKPVKGQMLAVVGGPAIQHVVRSEKVYLLPRSDGRIVIGSTLENAGFDKQTDARTIQELFDAAVRLVPKLAKSRRHEAWAGLRPGTPDQLPILGETSIPGYFIAGGHYRDGILLAPITALVMADLITGGKPPYAIAGFSPARFAS